MNHPTKIKKISYLVIAGIAVLSACKKENAASSLNPTGTALSSSSVIAAAASVSASGASTDSVYIVQPCARGSQRDSISQGDLPAAVTSYLTANYSGYTFGKAFSIINSSGTITGYVAVIYYNNNAVGIEFDSSGNFVKVLEQREKGDLDGKGWHNGGRFEDRDGARRDAVALSSLLPAIQSYIAANFASDTLVQAFKNRDSSFLVLSKNNGVFATLFDASGNFIKRVQLPAKAGNCQGIEESALPANVISYLAASYPNYVFKKAFVVSTGGTLKGYIVVIDANNTKYALLFDGSGTFVSAKTIY